MGSSKTLESDDAARARRFRRGARLAVAVASVTAASGLAPCLAAAALPDGRAYELVSPADKHGNQAGTNAYTPYHTSAASENGEAVAYVGTGVFGDSDRGVQVVTLGRRTSTGWTTRNAIEGPDPSVNIALLNAQPQNVLLAKDLSRLMFNASGSYGPPNPSYDVAGRSAAVYLTNPPGLPTWVSQPTSPDASPKPGELPNEFAPIPIGGSPDLSTVYFSYCGTLTTEDAPRTGRAAVGLYAYRDGKLSTAGVLPDGTVDPDGASPASMVGACSEVDPPGFALSQFIDRHPISDDGERAFFVSPSPTADGIRPRQLYVRIGGRESVLVSRSELSGEAADTGTIAFGRTSGRGAHAIATPDGGTVIFASRDQLTADAPSDVEEKRYAFDVDSRDLRYLPATEGNIIAVRDGGRIIVSEDETLVDGEGTQSLKVEHDGETTIIGAYRGSNGRVLGLHLVNEGRTLVFQAPDSLSGGSGGTQQVYRWTVGDVAADCLSCPSAPDEAPSGDAYVSRLSTTSSLGPPGFMKDVRNVSREGHRVVFESPDALAPEDTNGKRDVYQWTDGRLELISSGHGNSDSYVMDSSPSGDDVFFATAQQLVPQDSDDAYDVYDARVGGGFPIPGGPRDCSGADCRASGTAPPSLPLPASGGNSGVGNVVPPRLRQPKVTGRVRVTKSNGRRGRVTLRVATPAAGRITVSGSGLRSVRRTAKRKAVYTVTVRLSRNAAQGMQRRGKQKVRVRVRFTPANRSPSSTTTVALTVRK